MKKLFLILPVVILFITSCNNETENNYFKEYIIKVMYNKDSIADIDGNFYHTVTIESQTWMLEDLKTRHYRNGDPITSVSIYDSIQWKGLTKGACCENTDGTCFSLNPVGLLYNWYAVADTSQVCPQGWHVPTSAEWNTLCSVLSKSKGDKIIELFNINGNAFRLEGGKFVLPIGTMRWWSSTADITNNAYLCEFYYDHLLVSNGGKKEGFNIRCIKDEQR